MSKMNPGSTPPCAGEPAPAPEASRRKVVIVEDEGLIAADLKNRLESAGYAVASIADSGRRALNAIAETSPDLVLMDIRIKGRIDGIEVAEQIREKFDLPVVYLTAYEDQEMLARAGASQAFGYLKKPISSSSLRGALELALAKHRHERYLREQRDWLSSCFSAVADAVVVTDAAGRISYLNPIAGQLSGCVPESALGQPWGNLVRFRYYQKGWSVDEMPPVEDLLPAAMLEGVPMPLPPDTCCVDAEGRAHSIEGTVAPRRHEGVPTGLVITFRDIGQRQFLDERKREEHKHEALIRMAAAVGSRLDTEIGIVAEESSRLRADLPANSPLLARVEDLEAAALDACGVVDRLESFAHPKDPALQPVELNDLICKQAGFWKQRVPRLTFWPQDLPYAVQADRRQLARALALIFEHAAACMKPDGNLVIETSPAELFEMGQWVAIRFSYPCFGEDRTALERAFEPDWASPGDGLAGAYARIRRMGGLLSAGFENGIVSWEVHLPRAEAGVAAAAARPAVLLIEPNARVGWLLQRYFDENGFNLVCVSNCQDAAAAAEFYDGRFSLLIANLPEDPPGRPELSAAMARLHPQAPIHWLTGYRQGSMTAGDRTSAAHLLTKTDLLQLAQRTLTGKATPEGVAVGIPAAPQIAGTEKS